MAAPFERKDMECFGYEPEEDDTPVQLPEESTNTDVVTTDINACAAFEAFSGAYLSTDNIDYDSLRYTASALPLSALSQEGNARETPADTYARLQKELSDFRADLKTSQPKEGGVDVSALLEEELTALDASLAGIGKDAAMTPFLNANFPATPADLKALSSGDAGMNSSALGKSLSDEMNKFNSSMEKKESKADESKTVSGVTYELMEVAPSSTANMDLVAIDKRVSALESVVGAPGSAADGMGAPFPDLVSGLVYLKRQLAGVSEPSKLEDKLRRINGLKVELEVLKEQKQTIAGVKSNAYTEKIEKVYARVDEWDTAGRLLPGVLARLQSINDVATEGSSALDQVKELKNDQDSVNKLLETQGTQLTQAKASLSAGLKEMEATFASLDAAMAKLL